MMLAAAIGEESMLVQTGRQAVATECKTTCLK